jgi:hypothetical protein
MLIFRGLRFKPNVEIEPFGIFEMASHYIHTTSCLLSLWHARDLVFFVTSSFHLPNLSAAKLIVVKYLK